VPGDVDRLVYNDRFPATLVLSHRGTEIYIGGIKAAADWEFVSRTLELDLLVDCRGNGACAFRDSDMEAMGMEYVQVVANRLPNDGTEVLLFHVVV
jgi:hypothetical protein